MDSLWLRTKGIDCHFWYPFWRAGYTLDDLIFVTHHEHKSNDYQDDDDGNDNPE